MSEETVNTVKMIRSEEIAGGGPITADVHPDEVSNYARGGWVKADAAPVEGDDKKARK